MSRIRLQRHHGLGSERARELATRMAEGLEREHGLDWSWGDDALRFRGPGLDGQLQVSDTHLELEVALGLALRPFRGRLETSIRERLDTLLASA